MQKGKATVCLEARLDVLDLASCCSYYSSLGLAKISKSALLAAIVSDWATALQANGLAKEFSEVDLALEEVSNLIPSASDILQKSRESIVKSLKVSTPSLEDTYQREEVTQSAPQVDKTDLDKIMAELNKNSLQSKDKKKEQDSE